jgi:hypothetical protein
MNFYSADFRDCQVFLIPPDESHELVTGYNVNLRTEGFWELKEHMTPLTVYQREELQPAIEDLLERQKQVMGCPEAWETHVEKDPEFTQDFSKCDFTILNVFSLTFTSMTCLIRITEDFTIGFQVMQTSVNKFVNPTVFRDSQFQVCPIKYSYYRSSDRSPILAVKKHSMYGTPRTLMSQGILMDHYGSRVYIPVGLGLTTISSELMVVGYPSNYGFVLRLQSLTQNMDEAFGRLRYNKLIQFLRWMSNRPYIEHKPTLERICVDRLLKISSVVRRQLSEELLQHYLQDVNSFEDVNITMTKIPSDSLEPKPDIMCNLGSNPLYRAGHYCFKLAEACGQEKECHWCIALRSGVLSIKIPRDNPIRYNSWQSAARSLILP